MRGGPSPNHGVPPDENPTDLLNLDDPDDDLLDERLSGDDDEFDDDEHRAVSEYLDHELDDDRLDDDQFDDRDFDGREYDDEGFDDRGHDDRGYDDREYDDEDFDDREYDEDVDDDTARGGRRARLVKWAAAVGVLVLLAGGSYFGAVELLGFGYEDYEGTGEADVVVTVEQGDVISAIGATMAEQDVVASSEAFVEASEDNERVLAVQPGYYHMKTKMSGEAAVARLIADSSRVGHVQVRAGTQLSDITQPDDSVTPGVFALLSRATCAELNGKDTCVSPEALSKAADEADLSELGVPAWAESMAANAERGHTLEGLIAPGVYDVKPGWSAEQVLTEVLTASAAQLEAAGLPSSAGSTPFSPYQILIIASIIEREAVRSDFTKVSSVIHNRLAVGMVLQMDSTVNYLLDEPQLTTADEDRHKDGPYNTYATKGLPPTPIASPSKEAIEAALEPEDTDYMYFVKCEENGLSCFAESNEEHNANVHDAKQRGIF